MLIPMHQVVRDVGSSSSELWGYGAFKLARIPENLLVDNRNGTAIRRDLSFEFFDFNQVGKYDFICVHFFSSRDISESNKLFV